MAKPPKCKRTPQESPCCSCQWVIVLVAKLSPQIPREDGRTVRMREEAETEMPLQKGLEKS